MPQLWFERSLLPDGWAERVRITINGATIAAVETGVDPGPGDERHGAALPGLCNVHTATASSAAWPACPNAAAGPTTISGAGAR